MKVLFLITGLGVGGAEVQICSLTKEFIDRGYSVDIIYLFGDVRVNVDCRATVKKIKLSKFNPFVNFFSFVQFLIHLRRESYDVIHSHMYHANIFSRIANFFIGHSNLICSAHNINEGGWSRMKLYRLTDGLCRVTTNVGQKSLDRFISIGAMRRSKSYAVYNGIDTDKFCHDKKQSLLSIKKKLNIPIKTFNFLI